MSWIYVTEAGARLGLREGRYVISREHEVLAEVPSEIVEGVTVIDAVQVSSRAIVDFLARDIPVTWLSTRCGFLSGSCAADGLPEDLQSAGDPSELQSACGEFLGAADV